MKKLLTLVLMLVVFTTALVSCDFSGNSEKLWSTQFDTVIVADATADDVKPIVNHVYNLTMKSPALVAPSTAKADHEIVIGDVGRDISDSAYSKFDRFVDVDSIADEGQSAYLIYAEGGSIAIAYSDIYARDAAITYVVENLTTVDVAPKGTLVRKMFNTLDFIDAYREAQREQQFAELEETLGIPATEMLKNIYSLYGSDLYIWLANLYDPDIGGFYYSNSARDNEGYLPDIESTVQALHIIDNSELSVKYANGWVDLLSDEMKAEMLAFAKGLQSATDGYFYHPQWGTSIGSSRLGRDHGWARELIDSLGAEPLYPYGADRKSSTSAASKLLTAELKSSDAVAAAAKAVSSKVSLTAAFDLSSEKAFSEYLSGLSENSYTIGNTINSNISRIKAAGLWNYLVNYLTEHQYENGLWEPEVSYNAINGCMKLCGVFGANYPNADKAIESIMSVLELPADDAVETICFIYNPWYALDTILSACTVADQQEYRQMLIARAPELITKTYQKLAIFRKDDGGFSMNPDASSSTSQGELVAIPGSPESDVNATGIGISTVVKHMFDCFGLEEPDIYCKYDTMYFLDILDGLGTIVKDVTGTDDPEVITFDDYEAVDGEEVGGMVKYPAASIQNNLGNTTTDEETGNYIFFTSQVVQNPDPNSQLGDLVLYVGDRVYDVNNDGKYADDGTGEMAGTSSSTEFFILNTSNKGDCYIFESDIYFDATTATNLSGDIASISFGKAYTNTEESARVIFTSYEKDGKRYLRLKENWAGADKFTDSEAAAEMPTNEWFKLRVELYKMYDENDQLMVKIKFYVDGKYAGESDSGYYQLSTGGAYLNRAISAIRFGHSRDGRSDFYFDNVYVAKSTKVYVEESIPEFIENNPNDLYDFETDKIESAPYFTIVNLTKGSESEDIRNYIDNSTAATNTAGSFLSIANDPKNSANSVLKIVSNTVSGASETSRIIVSPQVKTAGGQVYVLDFDYFFESENNGTYAAMIGMTLNYGGVSTDTTGQAIYKPTLTDGSDEDSNVDLFFRAGNTENAELNVAGGQWVQIRCVFDTRLKTYAVYMSLDGGSTWTNYMKEVATLKSKKLSTVELTFNATNATNRVQYIDDLSFTVVSELAFDLTDGTQQTYGMPLELVPSDTKVYDFESDLKSNKTGLTIYNAMSKVTDSIDSTTTAKGTAGSFMSLATDPTDATNQVLKVLTNTGSSAAATITLSPFVEKSDGKIYVFEFDYYLESEENTSWGSMDTFNVTSRDYTVVSSQAIYKPTLKDENNDGELDLFFRAGTTSDASLNISGGKWVKVRTVLNDSSKAKTLTTYLSTDGGKTWTNYMGTDGVLARDTYVVQMSLVFNATIAKNRVQYLDNLSFVQTDSVVMLLTNGTTITYN